MFTLHTLVIFFALPVLMLSAVSLESFLDGIPQQDSFSHRPVTPLEPLRIALPPETFAVMPTAGLMPEYSLRVVQSSELISCKLASLQAH